MARILMIFGAKKSQRSKLFDEKKSNDRNERKVPENSKNYRKYFRKILKIELANVINY